MERNRPPQLSKRDIEMAKQFGGTDVFDWSEYIVKGLIPSFDKGDHKERSIVNQPSHLKHWKKKGK